jgi:hypothetical protein
VRPCPARVGAALRPCHPWPKTRPTNIINSGYCRALAKIYENLPLKG